MIFRNFILNQLVVFFSFVANESVKVLDENDNTPVIQAPQIIEITEYHDTNDIIMSVKVTDEDDPNTLNGKTNIALINHIGNGKLFIF